MFIVGANVDDLIDLTAVKIAEIVRANGSIPLSRIEYSIDASYNLIFLAVERLVVKGNLRLQKSEGDYIISLPVNEPETDIHVSAANKH